MEFFMKQLLLLSNLLICAAIDTQIRAEFFSETTSDTARVKPTIKSNYAEFRAFAREVINNWSDALERVETIPEKLYYGAHIITLPVRFPIGLLDGVLKANNKIITTATLASWLLLATHAFTGNALYQGIDNVLLKGLLSYFEGYGMCTLALNAALGLLLLEQTQK